ncbi:D-alanyl-D-alanine carboxypeptidase [Actinomadura meyerae]|uniref:D-alanyl-D-alanine carboxypeptidase n=1 Tax=Actinomadura meyerae TaxID=240840 RepID=A0A239JKJ5_9ACTN|nr:serine hydrolase domain-containing protein [Actinomadura meyerae]SNT06401.1 D-alanyl-D-alanine carboxypeptidase [Actinomadura meyerae]
MMARRFGRPAAAAVAAATALALTAVPAPARATGPGAALATPSATASGTTLRPPTVAFDAAKLRATLDATRDAGMYGLFSEARDGRTAWDGASGVADVRTRRPVTPGMRQRVGSITKSFVAAAVLLETEKGRIVLDAPVGRYLPGLLPGGLGDQITVRMLLNHTSGIGDYVGIAFPSWTELSPKSLDEYRYRNVSPEQLIAWGLQAPRTGMPGERWSYSNTNYIIAGRLLEKVTGTRVEKYITRNVIEKAGLKHTYFPSSPWIAEPHPRMYESLYRHVQPPRDYSVYNMSWAWTAGALVSTMDDLNRFYRALLTGRIIGKDALAEMKRTVPVQDAEGNVLMNYGLGLYALNLPCGTFWGHDGAVFGAGTQALSSAGGARQVSVAFNLMKYQQLDANGVPVTHPIDNALAAHVVEALCGTRPATATAAPGEPLRLLPLQSYRAVP